jgi:putative transposase
MGYPSDLTDAEWALIEHYFQPRDRRGSASLHPRKRIVDAIFYVVKSGCQWRMLPNDFPPWQTVYDHFSRWNKRGVWEAALNQLNALHRQNNGRSASPSYGIIDSQSVKTEYASEERGIDGGKKVKGHKRHSVVDILGNLLHVSVHAANCSGTVAGGPVMARAAEKYPSIEAFSGDAGYHGTAVKFVDETLGLVLHISTKIKAPPRENGDHGKRGQTAFSTFYRIAVMLKKVVCPRFLQHPHGQGKLVYVMEGEVFNVAVDVRLGSPHFS